MTTILKVIYVLLFGGIVGVLVYYILGLKKTGDDTPKNAPGGIGGKTVKKKEKATRPVDSDDETSSASTDINDPRVTPRQEWFGGSR